MTGQIANIYSLRATDYHAYFVGAALWGWDVWGHNARCTPDVAEPAARAFISKVEAGDPVVLR